MELSNVSSFIRIILIVYVLASRILIAEDNPVNVKVLVMLLKKLKVPTIDVAANGQEAVDKFCSNKYDLIFMDIQVRPKL